jgi:hypothetical protein
VSFDRLSPAEKVAAVERHQAQHTIPGGPTLSVRTLETLRQVQLALVDEAVSDERFQELLGEWDDHLAALDAHTADAARHRLSGFTRLAEGLRGPAREEDAEA